MAAVLVLLPTAKAHLRITTTADDVDLQLKLDQAEAIILDYLGTYADAAWTDPATAPAMVTAAILLYTAHLFEHRGDDQTTDAELWDAITRLLQRVRTPALA